MKRHLALLSFVLSSFLFVAQSSAGVLKVLTNDLGYETSGPKHAVIVGEPSDSVSACVLKDDATDQVILAITPKATGPVHKWRNWYFWTLDFDSFATEGKYYLECTAKAANIRSFPFLVQSDLLERNTVSDVIYYFKEERSSGEYEQANRRNLQGFVQLEEDSKGSDEVPCPDTGVGTRVRKNSVSTLALTVFSARNCRLTI